MQPASLRLRNWRLPAWVREVSIFSAFLLFTAIVTWPWVTSLRDAISDTGDPYMIAWTMWWNYHQTLHDPLNLFHANIFYPYKYTLAFSEHDFGITLLFFPLFALGVRPLTVHSIATFSGFAFCGYGAFRLTRTLTNSNAASWIAGIVFAFIPYRFQLMSHLHYLFAGWIPLLLEALVLFIRERTWKRAIWLGVAFLMNGLTCITWLMLTTIPLAISALFLMARRWPETDNGHLLRAIPVVAIATILLVPFLWPYYKVSQIYHFSWPATEAIRLSAGWSDWFSAEPRTKFWHGFGATLPNVNNHLFPGLLPILLGIAALFWRDSTTDLPLNNNAPARKQSWLLVLDILAIVAALIAVLGVGYPEVRFFAGPTSDRALVVLLLLLTTRWTIAYPQILVRSSNQNLIDSIRSTNRSEAFWIGGIWTVAGFLSSIGMSFFANRVIYDVVLPFRSMRIPARAAMLCYVGLAVLAGVGATQLVRVVRKWQPKLKTSIVYAVIALAALFEFNAAPLAIEHGAVDIDALSQQLKTMNMRGGVVELPGSMAGLFPLHLAMLRAADHQQPLVNAASTFVSPISARIDELVLGSSGIRPELMDLLEEIPASYVVVRYQFITPDRQKHFEDFLTTNMKAGRLRLVGIYDKNVELYVVTKTEKG